MLCSWRAHGERDALAWGCGLGSPSPASPRGLGVAVLAPPAQRSPGPAEPLPLSEPASPAVPAGDPAKGPAAPFCATGPAR